ncbi:kinase-like domain-containing protein [Rhizophagus clarus]|uniref:Kinase-like domain-containing protein n=1 Tax=Rhizophagus clarus TaxID=94130 RepID=A0A8H3R8E2_9GLOM|nr:kinase-like domain-containing protein [Rhizophagus clarus]
MLNSSKSNTGLLEWIPYDRFDDIVYIILQKADLVKSYKAIWTDGFITGKWDNTKQSWERKFQPVAVALKTQKTLH